MIKCTSQALQRFQRIDHCISTHSHWTSPASADIMVGYCWLALMSWPSKEHCGVMNLHFLCAGELPYCVPFKRDRALCALHAFCRAHFDTTFTFCVCIQVQGVYAKLPASLPAVGGNEGVGVVVAVGAGVTSLAAGDRVIPAVSGWGTWQTHKECPEDELFKVSMSARHVRVHDTWSVAATWARTVCSCCRATMVICMCSPTGGTVTCHTHSARCDK